MAGAEIVILSALGMEMVTSLGSTLAGLVGSKALAEIFKKSVPSYFPEVYEEIERIMDEKLKKETIGTINKQINGLIGWIQRTYVPRKDSGASKSGLHNILQPQVANLAIHIIPMLQDKEFGSTALGTFVLGASIHLLLLQELAMVDPDVDNPLNSSYVVSIKKYSATYASYAEQTFDKIVSARKRLVTGISVVTFLNAYDISVWTDRHLKEKFASVKPTASRHTVVSARSDYLDSIRCALSKSMNRPEKTASAWRSLESYPLPTVGRTKKMMLKSSSSYGQDFDSDDSFEETEPEKRKKISMKKRFKTWILYKFVDVNTILKQTKALT